MIGRLLLSVYCCSVLASAWFSGAEPEWNGLSVTFGSFSDLPRTALKAENDGWTMVSDCDKAAQFKGVRYIKDNDYSVVLIFGKNGYIAGIQSGISKKNLSKDYPPTKQRGHVFQEDKDNYYLTAYFTDPARICTSGRSQADFDKNGTGTELYIQQGPNQFVRMPATTAEIAQTSWTKGKCFYTMGLHYWYNVTEDMSCDDFQPFFLLYNNEKLNAFGWAMGTPEDSKRFEHPPISMIKYFIDPVPKCLSAYPELSTMHVYLTAHPVLGDHC